LPCIQGKETYYYSRTDDDELLSVPPRLLLLSDLRGSLPSSLVGHEAIHEDDIVGHAGSGLDCLHTIFCCVYLVSEL